MKQVWLAIMLVALGINCLAQNKPINKLEQIKWLQGEWIMDGGNARFAEHWHLVNDTLFLGGGYGTNAAGDTLFKESLQIALQNDIVYYLPTIANQNNGEQVRFAAVELSPVKAVFENKLHDSHSELFINKTSDATIYAYVEGMQKGKLRKEEFRFKKK